MNKVAHITVCRFYLEDKKLKSFLSQLGGGGGGRRNWRVSFDIVSFFTTNCLLSLSHSASILLNSIPVFSSMLEKSVNDLRSYATDFNLTLETNFDSLLLCDLYDFSIAKIVGSQMRD